ncbi:MAG: diadenylate cyclase CdaA [Ruminococcus sp.]|jgi:diadenylate cyclase|nr:diadenylate cyclase CdaA [Ruminococcus sp.]
MDDLIFNIKSYISSVFPITIIDIIDIGVLAFLIYWGIKFVRETRAGGLIRGIVILAAAYFIASVFDMKAITFIMNNLFNAGIFAVLILFQPELRRTLEKMGHSKLSKMAVFQNLSEKEDSSGIWAGAIEAVCDACEDLSATTTGALIVFEQESKLGEQIATGTIINAAPSKELFGNIFYPKTPLHDGAVIMRDGIVLAAGCFLPKPQKEESINKSLGSRHRAAIGMSENSDAIIVVVSEETGTISVAENGELKRGFTRDSLKKYLRSALIPERASKPAKPEKKHNGKGGSK